MLNMTLAKRYVTSIGWKAFFTPDKAYIEKGSSSPEVRDFIMRSKFRANVYVITGTKAAIGASDTSTKLKAVD